MNKHMLKIRLEEKLKEALQLVDKKNEDYSCADDVHSNFKRMAQICRVEDIDTKTEEGIMAFFIFLKADRMWNIAKKGKMPKNEPILDSGLDSFIYSLLLDGWINE